GESLPRRDQAIAGGPRGLAEGATRQQTGEREAEASEAAEVVIEEEGESTFSESPVRFWRDSRGLLIFDVQGVSSTDYPSVCGRIADVFGLAPASDLIIGPEQ